MRDLLKNLASALALALLRRRGADAFRSRPGQLVALFIVNLAAGFAYDLYAIYPAPGRFDPSALPATCFWSLPLLAAAWLLSRLARRAPEGASSASVLLPVAVSGFALSACGSIASTLLAIVADYAPAVDLRYGWLVWVPVLWVAAAWAFGAPRIAGLARGRALIAAALAAAAVMAPQWSADPGSRLWVAQDASDAPDDKSPGGPGAERFLYGQMDQLEDALDQVAPGIPGVAELYSIEFAGSSGEDVFMSEAQGVSDVMADLFDTGERNVLLANSRKRPGEAPFATVTALQRALATVAERMNEDEDVLFLFLTSHGAPGSVLEVSLPPYQFEAITPRRLRDLLDESGIRYRVIVVSSCYSGGFVQALANDDTLVITASRADRTSFGCRDGQDWTDFGRAYFKEALPATGSFEGAFRRARELVVQREAAQKLTASEPQIFVGEAIRAQLQQLQTQKLGQRLMVRLPSPAARERGRG